MAGRTFALEVSGDEQKMQELLKGIVQNHGRALDAGLKTCARIAAREVRQAYARSTKVGLAGIASGTRAKRQVGKTAGKWPAVPTFSGRKPLYRAGLLGRSVDYMKVSTYNYLVGVEGGKPAPYNRPEGARTLDQLAVMQETGWVRTMPVTKRMRAYLMILFGRSTGIKGAGGRMAGSEGDEPSNVGPSSISIRIPPRPLWQIVFDANAETLFFDAFMRSFERVLLARMGRLAGVAMV